MRFLRRGAADASVRGTAMPSPLRESTFRWRGLRVQIADAAGIDLAAWLPDDRIPDTGATPDLRYLVECWQPAWGARGERYRVSRNGVVRYLGSGRERLGAWLRADLAEDAARATTLAVAGDAVVWRQRAILVPRPGRIGTSALVAALVRGGAAPHVERIAVLDAAGRVHASGAAPVPAAPALALVVATTFQPGLAWQPRVVRGARAVLPIVASGLGDEAGAASALRHAARLAPGLTTLQGPRGEAADAAPRILAALDEILDGPPASAAPAPRWLERARALAARNREGASAGGSSRW